MSSILYSYWGLNSPNYAIQINNGNYIISDYGNNRIIELDSILSTILKNYSIVGSVFFDYSEANETLLITSEVLNLIKEISWSDMDWGTTIWQSSYSLNGPQCATYKQGDVDNVVIADTGNNRVIRCDRLKNIYTATDYYKLSPSDTSTVHEISSFYMPYRVYQYLDGNISIVEKEGRPINFYTIESSSSSSSTEIRSSSSSSSKSSASSQSYQPSISSSLSSSSSSSSSSYHCPNNIFVLNNTTITAPVSLTTSTLLSLNINGSSNRNYYIQTYTGDTTGKTYDTSRRFYGNEDGSSVTDYSMLSIVIDSTTYYLYTYIGAAQTNCCTNMVGIITSGTFISAGFALIDVNGIPKFTEIFTKTM